MLQALLHCAATAEHLSAESLTAAMIRVERALALAQADAGVIPEAAARTIDATLAEITLDPSALAEGVALDGVPVPALLGELRAELAQEASDYLHWGVTSQDIVDTAVVLQARTVLDLLEQRLGELIAALARLADAHRRTLMLGRTRFQPAVPTVFGLEVAGWLVPLVRHRQRLDAMRPRVLAVQLGGAVGHRSLLGDKADAVATALAGRLELANLPVPWHAQRDGMVELGGWAAQVTGALAKIGQDVLLAAQGEVREGTGGGSSTMPHKANPIRSEALVSLGRLAAADIGALHQALLHAQDRDATAWQLEWQVLPRLLGHAGAATQRTRELLERLEVDPARMRSTLEATHGRCWAEAATYALIPSRGRADAQRTVRDALIKTGPALPFPRALAAIVPEAVAIDDAAPVVQSASRLIDAALEAARRTP